jgi:tetratricopeptide (TPR) repeat protein
MEPVEPRIAMQRGAFTSCRFQCTKTLKGTEITPVYQGNPALTPNTKSRIGLPPISSVFGALLIFALIHASAYSQQPAVEARFRLAQALELSGEYERAAAVYAEVLKTDSLSIPALDGLQRMWMQLKKYDDAIALIRRRLTRSPADPGLRATLGSVLYRAGDEKSAEAEWETAIEIAPQQESTYRVVAAVLGENRLLDRAAAVYRRGRVALKNPAVFTLELAQLLSAGMDYAGASREYVSWLRANPTQLSYLQSRMGSWMSKETARASVIAAVKDELRNNEDVIVLQLYGWLAMESRDYPTALTVYRRIDALSTSKGSALTQFADRALRDGAYRVAVEAYREAIELPLPPQRLPAAEFGEARALEELETSADTASAQGRSVRPTEAQSSFAAPVERYRTIVSRYPHTEIAANALFRIGMIQFRRLDDLTGALQSFGDVLGDLPGGNPLRYTVALLIGQIEVARGDTAAAEKQFTLVAGMPDALADQTDEAFFRLAEIDFFAGRFEKAGTRLEGLSSNLKADFANDALELQSVIQDGIKKEPDVLRDYAHALFLARQRKNSEAIAILENLLASHPRSVLADDALLEIASLQSLSGFTVQAVASYERLLTEFRGNSIVLDRAQFQLAETYQSGMHDASKAIAAFEKLLADFPHSIYAEQARKRVRQLRGDTL